MSLTRVVIRRPIATAMVFGIIGIMGGRRHYEAANQRATERNLSCNHYQGR